MKTYQVQFYLDRDESPIYVIEYAPEPHGGPGYVYIPPPDLNLKTILTGDSDYWDPNGKWHHATRAWGLLMQKALESLPDTGQPDGSRIDRVTLAGPGLPGMNRGRRSHAPRPVRAGQRPDGRLAVVRQRQLWRGHHGPLPHRPAAGRRDLRGGVPRPAGRRLFRNTRDASTARTRRDGGTSSATMLPLDPSGSGTWVKATGDLNRALERVVRESTISPSSAPPALAQKAGESQGSDDASPVAASPDDASSSVRWLLALPALGLAMGAAWLLWLGLRSKARPPRAS